MNFYVVFHVWLLCTLLALSLILLLRVQGDISTYVLIHSQNNGKEMWIIIFVEVKSVYRYYSSWDLKSVSGKRFHCNIKTYSCEASKKICIQFSFNTHKQFLVGKHLYPVPPHPITFHVNFNNFCMFFTRFIPNICEDFYFTVYMTIKQ